MRLDVNGLPPDYVSLDDETRREREAAALKEKAAELKRAAEQEAAELKKTEEARIAERTRPRRVVRVVRCGTSTARTAMYLVRLAGDLDNCHWASAEHCSAALQEALVAGKRGGFTEQDTVSLPVEPLKQLRKTRRSRDSRRTDYLVRSVVRKRVQLPLTADVTATCGSHEGRSKEQVS